MGLNRHLRLFYHGSFSFSTHASPNQPSLSLCFSPPHSNPSPVRSLTQPSCIFKCLILSFYSFTFPTFPGKSQLKSSSLCRLGLWSRSIASRLSCHQHILFRFGPPLSRFCPFQYRQNLSAQAVLCHLVVPSLFHIL